MGISTKYETLYLLNATLLICHEIDSAYWHEWQLFHLPGGIQLFVFIHFLLLPVVLYGYREVCIQGSRIRMMSLLLAGIGLFAALLHGVFIASGDSAFTLPLSMMLLLGIFIVSLIQFHAAFYELK